MKVFVTGGGGRLGNVVVRQLVDRGDEVIVLHRGTAAELRALKGLPVHAVEGDVRNKEQILQVTEGVDVVFHIAAKISLFPDRDGSVWQTNVEGTRNVAEAALKNGVTRFVHCSSHAALKQKPFDGPFDENNSLALDDPSVYHRSKAHAEVEILKLVEKGLPAVIVNPGTVIGPNDFEPAIFSQAMIDLYSGKIPFMVEGRTDYADVRDIAEAIIKASETGDVGQRYFLTGYSISNKEMVDLLIKVTGKKLPRQLLPLWLMYALLPFVQLIAKIKGAQPLFSRDMLHATVSNPNVSHAKAKQELGYSPRSLEQSMTDAFDWYEQMGWIGDAK